MRRFPLLTLIAPVLFAVIAAAASASGVTNFYRFTYQDSTSASNAARYKFMALGYGSSPGSQASVRNLIASIHKADPQTRVLLYKGAGVAPADPQGIGGCLPWNASRPYGGIPLSEFLVNANGVPLYNPTYGAYELDPGNPAVQQACGASAVALAKQGGYDGIFWDSISTSLFWAGFSSSNCGSASCLSDTNWHAAMASFVTQVSAALHANGLLSIGNISGGANAYGNGGPTYWQEFLQNGFDGAQEESFTSGTNHLPVPLAQWKQALANEAWNEAHGKYFLGNADVTTNQALNTYGLATLLLAAQGHSSWSTADGAYGAGEYWFPVYNTALALGQPLGAYAVQSNGLYVRRFRNGTVIVNPTTSTISAGAYGNMGAQSGLIQTGPAKSAGSTQTPAASQSPQQKSSQPRNRPPRLSGMTYAGRRINGVEVFAGETAFFGATVWDPNAGHHLTRSWNWGDGTLGCQALRAWACRGATMEHVYRRPGTYAVTLRAADRAGASVTGQMAITIHAAPRGTVFTAVHALGSSIATRPQSDGAITSTLVLPSRATSVVAVTTVAGCGNRKACVSFVRQRLLGRVVKRNVRPGGLRLVVRDTDRHLLRQIRLLRRAPRATLSATFTLEVRLAHAKAVRVVQHIELRF